MIKRILPVFALLLLFAMPAHASNLEIGANVPNIQATDINGNAFNLEDYKGKTVVLEWTNAECPFVVKHYSTNNMQDTQEKAVAMDNVVWVSINSSAAGKQGSVTPEEAKSLIAEKGAHPTTMILDPLGEIGHAYGAMTTPHMFVIDAEGKLAYMGAIDDNSSPNPDTVEGAKNYVLAALNDLSAGNPVTESVTRPYGCAVKY